MTIEELFDFSDKFKPVVKPIARNIECLNAIIRADSDRDKTNATKQLAYVAFVVNRKSFDQLLPESREEKIREVLGIEQNWIPTKQVQNAIEVLGDVNKSATEKMLDALRTNQYRFINVLENINKRIDIQQRRVEAIEIENPDGTINETALGLQMTALSDLQKMFMEVSKMTTSLGSQLREIKTYEDTFVKEQAEKGKNKQAGSKNQWEDEA